MIYSRYFSIYNWFCYEIYKIKNNINLWKRVLIKNFCKQFFFWRDDDNIAYKNIFHINNVLYRNFTKKFDYLLINFKAQFLDRRRLLFFLFFIFQYFRKIVFFFSFFFFENFLFIYAMTSKTFEIFLIFFSFIFFFEFFLFLIFKFISQSKCTFVWFAISRFKHWKVFS